MAVGVLVISSNGYGKVMDPTEFRQQSRGGKGVGCFKVTEDSGSVAAVLSVPLGKGERVLVATAQGQAILTPVDDIPMRSRTAGGVKVISLADGDTVIGAGV